MLKVMVVQTVSRREELGAAWSTAPLSTVEGGPGGEAGEPSQRPKDELHAFPQYASVFPQ